MQALKIENTGAGEKWRFGTFKLTYNQMEEDNGKSIVRLPEPKKEYEVDNQRQINRSIALIVEQLNSTFLTDLKENQERFTWFNG